MIEKPVREKDLSVQMVADGLSIMVNNGYKGIDANIIYCGFVSQYKTDNLKEFIENRRNLTGYYKKREHVFLNGIEKWNNAFLDYMPKRVELIKKLPELSEEMLEKVIKETLGKKPIPEHYLNVGECEW